MNRDSRHILAALGGLCAALAVVSCQRTPTVKSAAENAVILPSGDVVAPEALPADPTQCKNLRDMVSEQRSRLVATELESRHLFHRTTAAMAEARRSHECAAAAVEAYCVGRESPERCD